MPWRQPVLWVTAFLPIVMSAMALSVVLAHLARYGPAPQPDEGAAAHLWQILMVAQVPLIGFCALRWFPEAPKRAAMILAVQVLGALAALAPVFLLGW